MKKVQIIFLQSVLVLIGIVVLASLIRFPQTEGRNANTDLFSVYFNDPFLACVYVGSIPFFIGLDQAIKLLGLIGKSKIFSLETLSALQTIKYCALIIIGFVLLGLAYIVLANQGEDDIIGGVVMGVFIGFCSTVVASTANILERIVQDSLNLESKQ